MVGRDLGGGPEHIADTPRAFSAGGVICREAGSGVEVVLVGRSRQRLWALPKGTPEPGESRTETARREVQEETGLRVSIVASLGSIFYSYPQRDGYPSTGGGGGMRGMVEKEVAHYLMEPTGGDISLHDHEYDLVQWFPLPDALGLLTYDNERTVLERAQEALRAGLRALRATAAAPQGAAVPGTEPAAPDAAEGLAGGQGPA